MGGGVLFVRSIRDMGGVYFLYVLFETHVALFETHVALFETHVALFGHPRPKNSPISDLAPSWGGCTFFGTLTFSHVVC